MVVTHLVNKCCSITAGCQITSSYRTSCQRLSLLPAECWFFLCACTVVFFSGKKLFGDGYSGLEYDYRGLLRLYRQTGNLEMADRYANILQQWNRIRDRNNSIEVKPLEFELTSSLSDLVSSHF